MSNEENAPIAQATEVNAPNDQTDQTSQSNFTFDEIDSITSNGESAKEFLDKANDEDNVDDKEEKEEKEDKKVPDEGKREIKEDEEEDKEEKEEEEKEEKEEKKEEVKKEIKKVKSSFDGKELDLPAEAIIKHVVDGKEVEVSVQELLNNYSGKVPWDKKYSELSKERNHFKNEVKVVENYINDFRNLVHKNDMQGALSYFAEFAGVPPLEFKKQLRSSLLPQYEQYSKMSEEQKKVLEIKEENEFLKGKTESENRQRQAQQAHAALEQSISVIQETHKISDEDLVKAYDELVENYKGEITPEVIGQYYVHKNAYSRTEQLISSMDPSLLQNEVVVETVAKIILQNPEFTDTDVSDLLKQTFKIEKKRSKSEVLTKKVKTGEKKEQKQINKNKSSSPFSFDEL